MLTAEAERFGGRLLKTIGDEVMCSFPIPQRAFDAAAAMHETLRSASSNGRFISGTVRVKIGFHYGIAEGRGTELVGATPTIAQQVIGLAKPEEVLASGTTIEILPLLVRDDAQFMGTVESRVDRQGIDIYKLTWEESEDATQYNVTATPAAEAHSRLVITHQGKEFVVDEDQRHCRMGRIEGNDIVTNSRFSSRHHAEISYRHGRFHLKDESVNGTVVARHGVAPRQLHREEGLLEGEGFLVLGNTTISDTAATVQYRCEYGMQASRARQRSTGHASRDRSTVS